MNSYITIVVGIIIVHIGIYILSIFFSRKIVKLNRWGNVALEMIVLPAAIPLFSEANKGYMAFMLVLVVFGMCLLSFNIKKRIIDQISPGL